MRVCPLSDGEENADSETEDGENGKEGGVAPGRNLPSPVSRESVPNFPRPRNQRLATCDSERDRLERLSELRLVTCDLRLET